MLTPLNSDELNILVVDLKREIDALKCECDAMKAVVDAARSLQRIYGGPKRGTWLELHEALAALDKEMGYE